MGKARKPKAVKLIIGMLAKSQKLFDIAEEFFIKEFGPIDYKSPVISFGYTDYYKKEMGSPLKRKFISFKKTISPGRIAKIKLLANSIEEKLAVKINSSRLRSKNIVRASKVSRELPNLRRRINIDPGYISDSKLVLATTKDYFHRVYLHHGIYAEVTLRWRKSSFEPFEWTYPDYRSKVYIDILNTIRNMYVLGQTYMQGQDVRSNNTAKSQ
ncbi:MAG: hypothetical protein AUJ70_01700 [Candidatus Omnitrophica bacterium CG1_02_40_15]|nr:MAG: hypothetical protein AUJ70_01700 [Candidatus Omnitrophica bacterium CG1_02_40_15]